MSDAEFPPDLLDLKVAFLTTEAEIAAHAATLPSASAILAGKAEITDEQFETSGVLHARAADLAAQMGQHPYLTGLNGPDRLKAMEALTKAARSHLRTA